MFTGIVEECGEVLTLADLGGSARITVRGPVVCADAEAGASIAVNGCCLTVTASDGETFSADVMAETLRASSLGLLRAGSPVNLERATTPSTRLGGHLVQGHVDGTAPVLSRTPGRRWELFRIGLPAALARYVAVKGSVAVDGVSLTVVSLSDSGDGGDGWFEVSLIPTTLRATTLGGSAPGTTVNLEVDVVAKYVERLLGAAPPAGAR